MNELSERRVLIDELCARGTRIKYQGSREETITVDNQLGDCRLRFKRLVRRAEEHGRVLEQALLEDIRVPAPSPFTVQEHLWCIRLLCSFAEWTGDRCMSCVRGAVRDLLVLVLI